MRPRVTIIIPTYNRARLVGNAIQSVLDQDYPAIDILIVDDGSTDETPSVLQSFLTDPRVRSVRHETNRGVAAAKNSGLDGLPADSTYFGILDSDDCLLMGALDTLVCAFEAAPDRYSQVFGWCRDVDSGLDTGRMTHREGIVTLDDALAGRFAGEFWQLARHDLLGGRRFEPRATGGESSVWWAMMRDRPALLVDSVVRAYDSSGTDRVSLTRYTPEAADGRRWVYRSVLIAVGREMRIGHPRQYGLMLAELAKWSGLAGDAKQARAASRQALRYAPSFRTLQVWAIAWLPSGILRRLAALRARTANVPGSSSPEADECADRP